MPKKQRQRFVMRGCGSWKRLRLLAASLSSCATASWTTPRTPALAWHARVLLVEQTALLFVFELQNRNQMKRKNMRKRFSRHQYLSLTILSQIEMQKKRKKKKKIL